MGRMNLPVTQPTASTNWRKLEAQSKTSEITKWPHPLSIQCQTPDGRGFDPLCPTLQTSQNNYQKWLRSEWGSALGSWATHSTHEPRLSVHCCKCQFSWQWHISVPLHTLYMHILLLQVTSADLMGSGDWTPQKFGCGSSMAQTPTQISIKKLNPHQEQLCKPIRCSRSPGHRGFNPDPTAEAYSAPQTPQLVRRGLAISMDPQNVIDGLAPMLQPSWQAFTKKHQQQTESPHSMLHRLLSKHL